MFGKKKKSLFETIFAPAGFAVAAVSLPTAAITGWFLYSGSEVSVEAAAETSKVEAEVTKIQIASEERRALCNDVQEYIGDDTPNETLSDEEQEAVTEWVVQSLRSCTISYDDSFDSAPEASDDNQGTEP